MRRLRVSLVPVAALALTMGSAVSRGDVPPAAPARSESPAASGNLFDPARHMHVSEVKPGMTGYGLTVFHGTKIEKFDVEVLSVLKNFNPKYDVVLIKCKNDYLEHTGSIAGMSGSPIFLKDDAGKYRMIGAFAYGWPLTKDPIAGVQPIEYMLALPPAPPSRSNDGKGTTAQRDGATGVSSEERIVWSLKDAGVLPFQAGRHGNALWKGGTAKPQAAGALLGNADQMPRLEPLTTPLMTSGLPPRVLEQMAPLFKKYGLVPLQAGIGGSAPVEGEPARLEPGSVLAVPLLTGDVELTAIGTATEVLDGRVWGFGHPFNNEGRVTLPMGSGQINGIIPNIQTSFKLGSLTQMSGTITTDASVGVTGNEGKTPPMVPIELTISPADGSPERVYHFHAAQHHRFTPLIAGAAFSGALIGSSELPQHNTVDYDLSVRFTNGQTVRLANRAADATPMEIFGDVIAVMQAAADNPFRRVLVSKITGTIQIKPESDQAQILDVHLPKSRYRPGETIKAFVTYQPFHAAQKIMPVELELPRDLGPGTYRLVISDAERYFMEEQQTEPFRLSAESIQDVFAVLRDVTAVRENALYLRLARQPDGVAIGRTAMPRLPSSRREILLGAGRSDTTAFVSSTVKVIPTDLVMSGSAEFEITIEAGAKVAVGGAQPARVPTAMPPTKAEEPHRVTPIPAPKETPKPPESGPHDENPGEHK